MDEVGRGALAGPLCVGVVAVDASTASPPAGLRDSKELTPKARARLVEPIRLWALDHALGWASSQEIDTHGIIEALRLAGWRALAGLATPAQQVILDGKHNWLSRTPGLFDSADPAEPDPRLEVTMVVKADSLCASVAAASVLAKVARDELMERAAKDWPAYGWDRNKGYGSPDHLAAIGQYGPSRLHRVSWALPPGPAVRNMRG